LLKTTIGLDKEFKKKREKEKKREKGARARARLNVRSGICLLKM